MANKRCSMCVNLSAIVEGFQSNGDRMRIADCSSPQASVTDTSPSVHGDAVDSASIRYKLREGIMLNHIDPR